jgi:hypothetical protein
MAIEQRGSRPDDIAVKRGDGRVFPLATPTNRGFAANTEPGGFALSRSLRLVLQNYHAWDQFIKGCFGALAGNSVCFEDGPCWRERFDFRRQHFFVGRAGNGRRCARHGGRLVHAG